MTLQTIPLGVVMAAASRTAFLAMSGAESMDDQDQPRWYVAMAKPGRIFKAKDELTAKGFEVFVPIEKGYRRINGRRHKVEQPLFGRYIFVRIGCDEGFAQVHHSPDVETILPHGKPPEPARENMVEAIRALETEGVFDKTSKLREFDVGEKVRLVSGPFRGAMGEITRKRGHQRWDLIVRGLFAGPASASETDMELVDNAEEQAA